MKGFKSFGQKTDLLFGDRFNVVLGPNGSGKSNIMDALCFVLGKGSAKAMRAEKSANLIYNGGKAKQPSKEGEVSIFFDNTNKRFPLDTQEIKITRVIRQTGQSIYKVNDKRGTRQEILELLSHANIDPNGYNIILQGDITRLIAMSPNERRALIEEISGIGIYEDKKKKALKELDKVDDKLNEAEIILGERKTYLKELKKERDQAQKYKDLSDKIKRNKATYLNIQVTRKRKDKEKRDVKIAEKDEKINALQEKINALKADINQKREEIRTITKEIEEKGEKEQVDLLKEIERLKIEVASNKTRIESHKNELERIKTRKEQLNNSLGDINNKIKEIGKNKEVHEREKTRLEKEIEHINSKITKFREKNKLDDAENIDKDIEESDAASEGKQREIQDLREEQQHILREKDKVEYQLITIDEKVKKVLEIEKEHKEELEKIKRQKDEFKKATLDLNKAIDQDVNYAKQIGNARNKLNVSREELAKLQARSTSIKESAAGGMAARKILENKNKFKGEVFGTVAELAQVDSKYSTALEIAAGQKIKSIVVDSDKTAAECIRYLKSEKLGVAKFIPINKIRGQKEHPEAKKLATANGAHGTAMSLLSFKPQFKNVFSYVFGSTLVVDNIDAARRIGVGSIRMATMDGDLTESSGAMQGGFRQKKRSGLGFQEKEVTENIEKLEVEVQQLTNMLSTIERRRVENEESIQKLRNFKATLEAEIGAKEKSLHLESDDLNASKSLKKELKVKEAEFEKQLMSVNMKISKTNSELAQIKIKKQKLREKINELRNPRLIAEINAFEQKRREFREKVIELEGSIKNVNMQIKNILGPEEENIMKIIKQHNKEEENFKEEIKTLKETIKVQGEDLKVKEKKQREYYGQFKGLFKRREELNTKLQKLESRTIGEEEHIRKFEHEKTVYSLENARIGAELLAVEEEYKKYEGIELFSTKSEEDLKREIWEFERMVDRLGNVNLKALEIYDSVEKEYNSLIEKREMLSKEKEEVLIMMNEIETRKKELFLKTFEILNENFQEMFLSLSTKGDAFLQIENPKDPLADGVAIKVRITGKKFLDIRSLSGGEKTMTALAFIFAIQEHEPASFYIFDEVDAALDKKNSSKLAELVAKYADRAQYIIISHNDGVITKADTLYGVSMTQNNMSKVISLKV